MCSRGYYLPTQTDEASKKTDHYQFLLDEDRIKIKNLKYIILYEEEKLEPINIYKHTLQKLYPNATIHLVEPNKEQ